METISFSSRTARIEHTCAWCGGIIKKGEKYHHQRNKFDGMLYSWKSHLDCKNLVRELDMYDDGDGITEEDFKECLDEFLYEKIGDKKYWELDETKTTYEKVRIALKLIEEE